VEEGVGRAERRVGRARGCGAYFRGGY
jgi:hypothetical protein